jgi:hypothetical protein
MEAWVTVSVSVVGIYLRGAITDSDIDKTGLLMDAIAMPIAVLAWLLFRVPISPVS